MKKVLIDTTIWSEVFRRRKNVNLVVHRNFRSLVEDSRVVLIGPIRQEVLSGIQDEVQFQKLRDLLRAFEDVPFQTEVYELAAELNNRCRSKGVQGSHIDYMICAFAVLNELQIYTKDKDFRSYAKIVELDLYKEW